MMKPDTPKLTPLSAGQEHVIKEWAADDRLWTTQETVEFNLRTFARKMISAAPKPDCVGVENFNVGDLKFALENWGNLDYKSGCEWAHHLLLAYRDEIYKLVEQRDIDDGPELPNASIMGWKKPLIIKAWRKGLSLRDVGEIFDVSHDTVHRITMNLDRLSDDRHVYEPNKRYPFQCEHCGYPEHETLKHTTAKGLLAVKEKAQEDEIEGPDCEPRTAAEMPGLTKLMNEPGVLEKAQERGEHPCDWQDEELK